MDHIYLRHDMDVIYFFYGLSLFIMGTSILAQYKLNSIYKAGRIIWLLGVFGILHGTTEWLYMWEFIKGPSKMTDIAKWGFLISSYCFLLDFGLRMCLRNIRTKSPFRKIIHPDFWLIALILLLIMAVSSQSSNFLTTSNILSRYFMGFTGSVLTGVGFIAYYYSDDEKLVYHADIKFKLWALAISFFIYGVLSGLIVPIGGFFPASVINVGWFHSSTNLPIRLIRGLIIMVSSWNIGRILSIFQLEANYRLHHALDQRKLIAEELIVSREQLRTFTTRLQSIVEKEKASIARELHDDIGQALTSLKIDVNELSIEYAAARTSVITGRIGEIEKFIDTIIDRMHNIATELRPSILDQLGLLAAMQWHARKFGKRTGINCELRYNDKIAPMLNCLSPESSITIFRLFQEALTNVYRHANARKANIYIYSKDGKLLVKIVDDGIGIDTNKIFDYNSLGLLGMRERVSMLGWHMDIKGRPCVGTTIKIIIPDVGLKESDFPCELSPCEKTADRMITHGAACDMLEEGYND
ncbi:MAG: sensor histidine kinase [Nitrospirae bacterium]|nr:sensor histidine kinase [Nitrospirota bacterium]